MKRAGVLLFYQIVRKHELGDPCQNAAHQTQLQYFSVAEVLGKLPVQSRIQCALGLRESQLLSQRQHCSLSISEGAVLRVIKRVNLFFSEPSCQCVPAIALITKATAVQGREPESQELLIRLRDCAAAKDISIERANIPAIEIRMVSEDLKKRGVAAQCHRGLPRRGDVLGHVRCINSI